jgi:3-deoxy-D-manno-octulosonic-acid transferase
VRVVRRSALAGDPRAIVDQWPAETQALLLDTHGELRDWYRLSFAAFVGGTWAPLGGHNLFEPAGVGCPVAFGPRHEAVADAADLLLAHGGGICVESPSALAQWLFALLEDAERRASAREGAFRAAEDLASGVGETRAFLEREPACRWLALQSRIPTADPSSSRS